MYFYLLAIKTIIINIILTYFRRNTIALNGYFFREYSSIFKGDWIQPTEENRDEIHPRKYTQIHTPTVVRGTGGGGWMEPLPGVFDMLLYFETILTLVESLDLLTR